MNISGLSFNALPPIDLPFRFFISAPLFALLCSLLIFSFGESLWLSRWQPSILALTHGFTLGFLTMVMMGALFQLLPVVGGIGIARPRLIATTCHSLLVCGTLSLMANFLWPSTLLFIGSFLLLASCFVIYLAALAWVLVKKLSQGDTITGFRLAISALMLVVIMGLMLVSRSQPWFNQDFIPSLFFTKQLTNNHAVWGLVGWAGLLIIAVSFQVIPMFHVAPSFNRFISRYLPLGVFIALMAGFYQESVAQSFIVILHAVFAISLLWVINKRKRKVPDTSIQYWQSSAICLLLLNVFYFVPYDYLPVFIAEKRVLLITGIFIYFYLMSVIQGMLLKILPFLSYTHLQQSCLTNFSAMAFIPHMHEFLNKKHGQWLFYLHLFSGSVLLLTIIKPSFYWIFSSALFIECLWLLFIMTKTIRLYFSVQKKIHLSSLPQS